MYDLLEWRRPVRVGSVTARTALQYRRHKGILLPEPFWPDATSFTDESIYAEMGAHVRENPTENLYYVEAERYQDARRFQDNQWAYAYEEACKALNGTPAAEKARELLFSYLLPCQRKTAEREGYFHVGVLDSELTEFRLRLGLRQGLHLNTIIFGIDRTFPNGNVSVWLPDIGHAYTACIHPLTPYPLDDICLGQLTMILMDPDKFMTTAHLTARTPEALKRLRRRRRYGGMWPKYRCHQRTDIALPYLKNGAPPPANIILGTE